MGRKVDSQSIKEGSIPSTSTYTNNTCICGNELELIKTKVNMGIKLKSYKCKKCKWTTTTWEIA